MSLKSLPSWVPYAAPFALFLLLTTLEVHLRPWLPYAYAVKIALVTILLVVLRKAWPEARPGGGGWVAATALGVALLFLWIFVDKHTHHFAFLGHREAYNPFLEIPNRMGLIAFLGVRFFGLVVIVPIIEELFYRSFLLRFVTDMDDFQRVPMGTFSALALGVNVLAFASSHPEWLAAAIFALAMCLLLRWTKNLFACILAHGTTNLFAGDFCPAHGAVAVLVTDEKMEEQMIQTIIGGALTALLMAARPVWSQAEIVRPVPVFASASQGITAHGHGEVKIKPDIARLTAAVTTQAKYQDKAVQDNAGKMTALLTTIRSLKIADKDIQTPSYSVEPQYDYSNGQPHLTGYQVTNSVEVTLRDLAQTGILIDTITQAEVNRGVSLNGVSYDLSDPAAAQDQALGAAVTDAMRRAHTMANALGYGLGSVVSLNDSEAVPAQPIFMTRMQPMSALAASAPTTPISAQQITVTADVTIEYSFK